MVAMETCVRPLPLDTKRNQVKTIRGGGQKRKNPVSLGKTGKSEGLLHWCARQDLNLHALRHYHLKSAQKFKNMPNPTRF